MNKDSEWQPKEWQPKNVTIGVRLSAAEREQLEKYACLNFKGSLSKALRHLVKEMLKAEKVK